MNCSWPELVGKDADEAVAVIKSECEDCQVRVRPEVGWIFKSFIEALSHDDGSSHRPRPRFSQSG